MAQNLKTWAVEGIAPRAAEARMLNSRFSVGVVQKLLNTFKVAPQTGTPNMTVRVGSGAAYDEAYVKGAANGQGTYGIRNPDPYIGNGNSDVSFQASHATFNRYDLVILRTYDDQYDSSGQNKSVVEVVTGQAASSPQEPALPAGASAIVLARVTIRAGTSSIVATDIADRRIETQLDDVAAPPFRVGTLWLESDRPLAADGAGPTKLQWNGEDDPFGMHNAVVSTERLYAPLSGFYHGVLQASFPAGNTKEHILEIQGNRYVHVIGRSSHKGEAGQVSTPHLYLDAGQYMWAQIYVVGGSSTAKGTGRVGLTSWFYMSYLGHGA